MRSAALLLGVPVGDVAECRALLLKQVDERAASLGQLHGLRAPLAQLHILRQAGLRQSLEFVLAGCGADVVDAAVTERIAAVEEALLADALGRRALPRCVVLQAGLPPSAGGLGLLPVDWAGHVVDRRWRLRTPAQRATWTSERRAAMAAAVAADPVQKRRWEEQQNGTALRWLTGSTEGLIAGDRACDVEEALLCTSLGVPLLSPGRVPRCPAPHANHEDVTPLHMNCCRVCVVNQRHDALRDSLAAALREVYANDQVLVEQGVGPDGRPRARQYGGGARAEHVPGDVVLAQPGRQVVWFDCVVRAGDAPDGIRRGPAAAEFGYSEKKRLLKGRPEAVHVTDFCPVAMSHWSALAAKTQQRLESYIGPQRLDRVVLLTMLAQANGQAVIVRGAAQPRRCD